MPVPCFAHSLPPILPETASAANLPTLTGYLLAVVTCTGPLAICAGGPNMHGISVAFTLLVQDLWQQIARFATINPR